ncbi:Uroporphyrinogen-III synthase [hydrothermal vent metagenome]|uniref:uroporphyrinogen-III synthase n=1 Tax=hydrothermal vent metagenome TaxID=652676 RepID=A0A1W1CVW6_9ZZZZ
MSKFIYLLSPLVKEGTVSLPMIGFQLVVAEVDLSDCDILMFTSKQAVKSAEVLNPKWKEIPCLSIGSATTKQIESLGGKVVYQPESFYGKVLSEEIVKRFRDKHILYLRPKEVSFNSKAFLASKGIMLDEKIIYETQCKTYDKNKKPKKNAVIIFTSPSTIHCFLKNFTWDESYTAVVIGEATKEYLPVNANYVVANTPTINACVEKAKQI